MKRKTPYLFSFLLALIVTGLVALLNHNESLARFEYTTLDWRFQQRNQQQDRKPDERLFLVAIDQNTFNELGAWPFPRTYHAQLTSLLAPEKPAVMTWDIIFADNKQNSDEDFAFAHAIASIPNFISGVEVNDNVNAAELPDHLGKTVELKKIQGDRSALEQHRSVYLPIEAIRNISYFGLINDRAASDGVRRYNPLVFQINGRIFANLSLISLMRYYGVEPEQVEVELGKEIRLPRAKPAGQLRIPINSRGEFLVNYRSRLEDFSGMNYALFGARLLGKSQGQQEDLPILQDKIVMVGLTASGYDTGPIPIAKDPAPLVTVHLNALNNFLQEDFLQPAAFWIWVPLYFLAAFGLTILKSRLPFAASMMLWFGTIVLYIGLCYVAFIWASLWVPIFWPVSGWFIIGLFFIASRYTGEEREKRYTKKVLSSYLSKNVLEDVLAQGVTLGGQKSEITVMFCDIRGFTSYCDNRDPQEVVGVLNDYLEVMTSVIHKYDGTLDKYIGDCIMAFWGAPRPQLDHAQRAVCAALEMRYALANYKTTRVGKDQEVFECGIGIHTGEAVVGNMGSSHLKNYTVLGSTVNMAARLEAMTKRFACRILISEATRQCIEGEFTITELGEATIPGFSKPTRIYSVEAYQDINSALQVGRTLAKQAPYTAEEVTEPLWKPAPLPEDADPNP